MLNNEQNDIICKIRYCNFYNDGYYLVEVPKESSEIPWTWGWWKDVLVERYFEAEKDILGMFEDESFIDSNGYINEDKMCRVIIDRFSYNIQQIWTILNELIAEGLVIDPSLTEGELKLDFEAIYGPLKTGKCYYGFANPPWDLIKEIGFIRKSESEMKPNLRRGD